ncbi:hypothetical protein SAY87_014319 [Trapa incisa]|uniref:Uncharacterized protein n=1 Tax=Trapa incisa TaxID=236973 RepID=A0AAN7GMV1_9MYRT|nr:hypothetical protein SAY87_014319 [Trapa incisa]
MDDGRPESDEQFGEGKSACLPSSESPCRPHRLSRVNSSSGKIGQGVIKAAKSAGLDLVPVSFGCAEEARYSMKSMLLSIIMKNTWICSSWYTYGCCLPNLTFLVCLLDKGS